MRSASSIRRIKAIAYKEIVHIIRDPFTLAVAILLPVFLVTLFGIAIDLDIRGIRLTVSDSDQSQSSRLLEQGFTNSGYFKSRQTPLSSDPEKIVAMEKAKAVLIIPRGFEGDLGAGKGAGAQILLDGADNSTIGAVMGYLEGILKQANKRLSGFDIIEPVRLVPRYLFNPEQKSTWFVVPGLSVVVVSILSILLTALTVAREWETGSMELLLSTPVRPIEIVLGKILPYLALGILGAGLVYLIARIGFRIPFKGSHLLFFSATVLFICAYLAQGLLISVIAKRQQIAMQMSIISGFLPSILLSGFIFSIQNMSPFWHYFTAILPARWYMQICRAQYLKGAGLFDIAVPLAALAVLLLLLVFAVTRRFKGNLEL